MGWRSASPTGLTSEPIACASQDFVHICGVNSGIREFLKPILWLAALGITLSVQAQSAGDLVRAGDALDVRFRNREAIEIYLKADALQPNDAEILRRIAKQYSQLMVSESRSPENKDLARKALDYAQRAVQSDPANANARLSLAICYGKAAFLEGARRRIEMSRLIREEAEAAIRIDPRLDYAWHVLGRWNYELANFNAALRFLAEAIYGKFPDASNERAAECFEKAVAFEPDRVIHHVELGRTYAALGRKPEALAELKKGLSLPSREKDDNESKDRARKAIAALQ
jgi:tetratricopeptide (TPR) repeat protein